MNEHLSVMEATVEVAKINPPIGGDVGYVSVEREEHIKIENKSVFLLQAPWPSG